RVAFYLGNLLRLVPAAGEGLGYAAAVLAALGAVVGRPRAWRDPRWVPLATFALMCLVIPPLRAHQRFLLGYGVLLLPLARAAPAALAAKLPPRALPWLLVLAVARDLVCLPQAWQRERIVERELGLWLRPRLRDGERVATEMPRLELF